MPFIFAPAQLAGLAEFYHQLGTLTEAGLGLPQVMAQLHSKPPVARLRDAAGQIAAALEQGFAPGEAFRRCAGLAPEFDLALITAGERSGRLDQVFKLLSRHYSERAKLIRQTLGQLAYPVFVAHFAVLIFPVGYLTGLLDHNGLSRFIVQKLCVLIPCYALLLIGVFAGQGRHGERWRALMERIFRLVPLLGTARRCLALSRFAAALESLLNAGVGILPSLDLASAASGSPGLRADVLALLPRIESGLTPAEGLALSTEFPDTFTHLYTAGEVSGKLDETLGRLHAHFHEEGTRKLKAFAALAGHAVHLAIMLGIAWQVISFYLGYFNQLNEVMK